VDIYLKIILVFSMSKILILSGSGSDFPVVKKASSVLDRFGLDYDVAVASAHRTPHRVFELVSGSEAEVFIVIAGMAAALPGAVASYTLRPVIGVPVSGKLDYDALLSIVQMPPGIPVATVGMDRGDNAAVLAVQILALSDNVLAKKLVKDRESMAVRVKADSEKMRKEIAERSNAWH